MKVSKLIEILSVVPGDIDVVLGRPHVSVYWEPEVLISHISSLWRLTEEYPDGTAILVTYHPSAEQANRKAAESTLEILGVEEVVAVCLT